MLALDLVQPVPHRLQKVVVGVGDGAIEPELDHRLHAANRRDLAGGIQLQPLPIGDVLPGDDVAEHSAGGVGNAVDAGFQRRVPETEFGLVRKRAGSREDFFDGPGVPVEGVNRRAQNVAPHRC